MPRSIDEWVELEEIELERKLSEGHISQKQYQKELEWLYRNAREGLDERRNEIVDMFNNGEIY